MVALVLFMGCEGVCGGVQGELLFQKRLRLSRKVDECKPLAKVPSD